MNKGINTLIKETKDNITKVINDGLKTGLPIAVIDLMVDNIMFEVKNTLDNALKQESEKYNEQLKIQEEQIEWVEPTDKN